MTWSTRVQEDLRAIEVPPGKWTERKVAIVGAGMAGLAAAFQLLKVGIKATLFDESEKGLEGPWVTYARMKTLRSGKDLAGPALDFPSLTFRVWYEEHFGKEAWIRLSKIPNALWQDYLNAFREVLGLEVFNQTKIKTLNTGGFELGGQRFDKVILATGRLGFGGPRIPAWAYDLPKAKWAHTTEAIDFTQLKDKKVGIVGVGASGFDAAAAALEAKAYDVELICRRGTLHNINKFASLVYPGFMEGFYDLEPLQKCEILDEKLSGSSVPPHEALERIQTFTNFRLVREGQLEKYDFIIFATGFAIDGWNMPELKEIMPSILLWEDILSEKEKERFPYALPFPYLGAHFEFLPKKGLSADFLKNLYCFNWGALLSHGLISGDIPGIGVGARRLAVGVAADIFKEDIAFYIEQLKLFDTEEFSKNFFKII